MNASLPSPAPPRTKAWIARIGSPRWIGSLAALTATTALSIDTSLPAQPTLAREFHVTSAATQLTLSVFLLGYALGQVAAGFLADGLGRRRVLLGGLAVFTLGGIGCTFSPALAPLVAFRFVQGLGAASGPVLGRAMVRDTQTAGGAARLLSIMVAALAIAPMLAPLLGAFLLAHFDWHAIFGMLTALGLAFLIMAGGTLEETLPVERRRSLSPVSFASALARFFRTPGTHLPIVLVCAAFAGQFAFISASPFVLIEGYGIPASQYGLYFGATALALMAASITGSRLLKRGVRPEALVALGSAALALGGMGAAIGSRVAASGPAGLMVPLLVYFAGIGFVGPSATALAMDPVPEIAGVASSAIGFLQMLSGAASGYLATRVGGSDPRGLGAILGGVGLVAAGLTAIRLRTRAGTRATGP